MSQSTTATKLLEDEQLRPQLRLVSGSQQEAAKYRINSCENGTWVIFDESDTCQFVGSIEQCQEWLDREENREHNDGFLSFIRQLISRGGKK